MDDQHIVKLLTHFHQLGGRLPIPVTVELRWCPCRPLEVSMVFVDTPKQVEWILGRDLLTEGLTRPVGDGDVRIHPARGHHFMRLELRPSRGESALFAVPCNHEIAGFLAGTRAAAEVAFEKARHDLDRELAAMLQEADRG